MNEQQIHQWLASSEKQMQALLCQWVNINSGSFHLEGLKRMRAALLEAFTPLAADGVEVAVPDGRRIDDKGKACRQEIGSAIRFIKRPNAAFNILLVGHMDTVFGKESTFQSIKKIDDTHWQGPGIIDMKGGLVAMLYGLLAFERYVGKASIGWEVVITADEEIGSHSSASLLKQCAQNNDIGFVYEPALDNQGTLVGRRKGSGCFTLCVWGKTAHAGRAFKAGKSAIVAISEAVGLLHAMNDSKTQVNIGVIDGGEVMNQVPGFAKILFNVRIKDSSAQSEAEKNIQAIVKKINAKKGFSCKLTGGFTRPPKIIDEKTNALLNLVKSTSKKIGQEISIKSTGGVCDGNLLSHYGLPNVDTLGVIGEGSHTENETLVVESLRQRASLTFMLLKHFADIKGKL